MPKSTLNKYHLVLASAVFPKPEDQQRDITGADFIIRDACLILQDKAGEGLVAYAPGTWTLCEKDRKDE